MFLNVNTGSILETVLHLEHVELRSSILSFNAFGIYFLLFIAL